MLFVEHTVDWAKFTDTNEHTGEFVNYVRSTYQGRSIKTLALGPSGCDIQILNVQLDRYPILSGLGVTFKSDDVNIAALAVIHAQISIYSKLFLLNLKTICCGDALVGIFIVNPFMINFILSLSQFNGLVVPATIRPVPVVPVLTLNVIFLVVILLWNKKDVLMAVNYNPEWSIYISSLVSKKRETCNLVQITKLPQFQFMILEVTSKVASQESTVTSFKVHAVTLSYQVVLSLVVTPNAQFKYPFLKGGFLTLDRVMFTNALADKLTPAKLHWKTGIPGRVDALTSEPTLALLIFSEHVTLLLDRILETDEVQTPPQLILNTSRFLLMAVTAWKLRQAIETA